MNDNLILAIIITVYFSPVIYQFFIVIKEYRKENKAPFKKFFRFLKYSLLLLITLGLVFLKLNQINFLDYEKPIPYNNIDKITFENFRGFEFFKKSLHGNKHFAYIVTTIEDDLYKDSLTIKALFHPSRSYVYNKYTNSKALLTHELYHFKITEMFARKAKQKIKELKINKKNELKHLINEIKKEERAFQKKYDYDTYHSYVLSEQKKYEKFIDSSLNLLTQYSKDKIYINEVN